MTHQQAICQLFSFGETPDPLNFELTLPGFQRYLTEHGVQFFAAEEVCKFRHPVLVSRNQDMIASTLRGWDRGILCTPTFLKDMDDEVAHLPEHLDVRIALPPRDHWPRLMACILVAEKIRIVTRSPIDFINGWRPACINKCVGGASRSGHIGAYSVDLAMRNEYEMSEARMVLSSLYSVRELGLSVGWGKRRVHLGFDERGHRQWAYS